MTNNLGKTVFLNTLLLFAGCVKNVHKNSKVEDIRVVQPAPFGAMRTDKIVAGDEMAFGKEIRGTLTKFNPILSMLELEGDVCILFRSSDLDPGAIVLIEASDRSKSTERYFIVSREGSSEHHALMQISIRGNQGSTANDLWVDIKNDQMTLGNSQIIKRLMDNGISIHASYLNDLGEWGNE